MLKRNCPSCNIEIFYKNKRKYQSAIKNGSECRSCCKKGDKNPMFGLTEEKNPNYGQIRDSIKGDNNPSKRKEVREKISKSKKGVRTISMLGKHHREDSKKKSSISNRGQKRSPSTIEKIREKRKLQVGDKCPGWKGGITSKLKILRNNDEYANWRKQIFERDNYKCRICNEGGNLNAHHIVSFSERLDIIYEISNGLTLCYNCHNDFHKKYGKKNFPNILEIYQNICIFD